jgi:hypothetical protein
MEEKALRTSLVDREMEGIHGGGIPLLFKARFKIAGYAK